MLGDVEVNPEADTSLLCDLQHGRSANVKITLLRPPEEHPFVDERYLPDHGTPFRDMARPYATTALQALAGLEQIGLGPYARWGAHRHGILVQTVIDTLQLYRDMMLHSVYPPANEPRAAPPRSAAEHERLLHWAHSLEGDVLRLVGEVQ